MPSHVRRREQKGRALVRCVHHGFT
jgi:hypothetical protein